MNKNSYLVIVNMENGKRAAYVQKWHNSNNLACLLKNSKIESANICDSKKEAQEIAEYWNQCYKRNGCYMYA